MSDLISRQAAIDALDAICDRECEYSKKQRNFMCGACRLGSAFDVIEQLPSAQPEQQWIPVKMRPMDSGERECWEDQFGEKLELEDEDAVLFDCPMPKDGQEILVSYRKWISMDKCEIDDGCYGLEGNGDWEDVIAWMPLPEPYKEEN